MPTNSNKRAKSNLIVYFIPPNKIVNGGVMSIFSLCKESRRFTHLHNSDVVLCTYPGSRSYRKNDLFSNNEKILSFSEVVNNYPQPDSLTLNIPEYASEHVYRGLLAYSGYLNKAGHLQINIMSQNIQLMPSISTVASLMTLTSDITQTTAHVSYSNQDIADKYGLPTHLLSVFIDPNNYKTTKYETKKRQIVISPDWHSSKAIILRKIKRNLPDYKLIKFKKIPYESYKKLISSSMYCITFGEGFDGYYIESIFSGTIAFATYNNEFFPSKDYVSLPNIFKNYTEMSETITRQMKKLEEPSSYQNIVKENTKKLSKIYNYNTYIKNIENYYMKKYSYRPTLESRNQMLLSAAKEKDRRIHNQELEIAKAKEEIKQIKKEIRSKNRIIQSKDKLIRDMTDSKSWKYTKPLRYISSKAKVKKHG